MMVPMHPEKFVGQILSSNHVRKKTHVSPDKSPKKKKRAKITPHNSTYMFEMFEVDIYCNRPVSALIENTNSFFEHSSCMPSECEQSWSVAYEHSSADVTQGENICVHKGKKKNLLSTGQSKDSMLNSPFPIDAERKLSAPENPNNVQTDSIIMNKSTNCEKVNQYISFLLKNSPSCKRFTQSYLNFAYIRHRKRSHHQSLRRNFGTRLFSFIFLVRQHVVIG